MTIGIVYTDYRPGVMKAYINYMQQFSSDVVLLMPNERRQIDLLLVGGGPDLNSTNRGYMKNLNSVSPYHGRTCPYQNFFFEFTLDWYIDNQTPIFGICLGAQVLASKFKSSLYAHIDGHVLPDAMHKIAVNAKWSKKLMLQDTSFSVTSRHHQAVKELGPELIPIAHHAIKDSQGVVEAFLHSSLPIAGVQSHPEDVHHIPGSYLHAKYGDLVGDPVSNSLFRYLLKLESVEIKI